MKNGKIDSTSDFTTRGLGQLKTWLQPWFLGGPPTPPITRAIEEQGRLHARVDALEARVRALEGG